MRTLRDSRKKGLAEVVMTVEAEGRMCWHSAKLENSVNGEAS